MQRARAWRWRLVAICGLAGCGSTAREHALTFDDPVASKVRPQQVRLAPVDMPCADDALSAALVRWRAAPFAKTAHDQVTAAIEARTGSASEACRQGIRLNQTLIALHRYDAAEQLAPLSPPTPMLLGAADDPTRYLLGHLHARRGAAPAAEHAFTQVSLESPQGPEAAFWAGRLAAAAGRHATAIARFEHALADPHFARDARYFKARSHALRGESDPALSLLLTLARAHDTEAAQAAAHLLAQHTDPKAIRQHLAEPGTDEVRRALVERLVAAERFEDAIGLADWALAHAPLSAEVPGLLHARRQVITQTGGAARDPAIVLSDAWMQAQAKNHGAVRAAIRLLSAHDAQMIEALAQAGQTETAEARRQAWRARFVDPAPSAPAPQQPSTQDPIADQAGRARAALQRFAFDEARALLADFVARYPQAPFAADALLSMGTIDAALGRSPVESWQRYLATHKERSDAASVRMQLATALGEAGRFKAQIQTLDALLAMPGLSTRQQMRALQAKADALVALGKPKAARPIWTRLMKGFPQADRTSLAEEDIRGRARFELLQPAFDRLQTAAKRRRFVPRDAQALLRLYDVLVRRRVPRWRAAALHRQAQIHLLWAKVGRKDAAAHRQRAVALLTQLLPRTRLFARQGERYRPALSPKWAARARIELCLLEACPPTTPERLADVPPTRTLALAAEVTGPPSPAQEMARSTLRAARRALDRADLDAAEDALQAGSARLIDFAEADLNLAAIAERRGASPAPFHDRAAQTGRLPTRIALAKTLSAVRAGETPAPTDPHAALRLALLTTPAQADLLTRATALLDADPRSAPARLNWAWAAWLGGDFGRALLALQAQESAEAHTLRGRIELARRQPEAAIRAWETAMQGPGGAPAEAYALRARLHHLAGEYARAEALNRAALARWPGLTAARINLALALRRQGDETAAIDLLSDIDDPLARSNLMLIRAEASRRAQARSQTPDAAPLR